MSEVTYQFITKQTKSGYHCYCRDCHAATDVQFSFEVADWMNAHEKEGCFT